MPHKQKTVEEILAREEKRREYNREYWKSYYQNNKQKIQQQNSEYGKKKDYLWKLFNQGLLRQVEDAEDMLELAVTMPLTTNTLEQIQSHDDD